MSIITFFPAGNTLRNGRKYDQKTPPCYSEDINEVLTEADALYKGKAILKMANR
jgi:hypothetical protein